MPKGTAKTEKSPIPRKMKAIERLFAAGIRTAEQLQKLSVQDMALLPNVSNDEVLIMLEFQKRSRHGTLYDYLCEE